ncbi:MAG: Asp-tRNA(Asn)/Glu-tRNA(Gln) amidotransferase subunit GatC [Pseudomonadales bacterium]|nr:Asp-tRNA(Asn)/Glu-tRNA(Gln) amidotransferase subunit GatC [Pseudomonadales bacterium]NRA18686.1 Asp-tRNA(Asn)/Glu-tRNA(Gln) amidotransferase subunit GatC [Oceanospirillaceae bacterium]
MALDRQDVEKIAHLARINIDKKDINEYLGNLTSILDLVDQMQRVDTQNVEPLSHPLDAIQRLRADDITESNQREQLQQVAPAVEEGLFLVPKVID